MRPSSPFVALAVLAACAPPHPVATAPDASTSDAPVAPVDAFVDDVPPHAVQLAHTSDATTLAPGFEDSDACESWLLDNTETIYVHSVAFHTDGGMHHSNWFFVPSSLYAGPDGRWRCSSRGFDEGLSAAEGGVLFAQSTQSLDETQLFPDGAVVPIPPHSRIVGQLHFLNVTSAPISNTSTLTLTTVPREDVRIELNGMVVQYLPLAIPPHARSAFNTTCDLDATSRTTLGRPLDMRLYYALPHYHALGTAMTVSIVGGPDDGHVAFASSARLGEPWGRALDPPVDLTGATGLRLTCEYNNPRDTTVHYGLGDQEMCVFFAFTGSEVQWAAQADSTATNTVVGPDDAGVVQNQAPCTVLTLASHNPRDQ